MKEKISRFPGRPIKEGYDFFPLDCTFFENDKVKALRRALGEVGILTYLNILTRIYKTHGYYYTCTSLDSLAQDIAEQISNDRIKRKTACVRETINYLIGHEILDRGLAERGIISGIAMQEKYIEMTCRARRKLSMDVYVLVDVPLVIQKIGISSEENTVIATKNTVFAEITQESKEKGKEILSLSITHARGKRQNVMLTDEELADLTSRGIPAEYIDHFSEKLYSNKYTYQNHHDSILLWWQGDRRKWCERASARSHSHEGASANFDADSFFEAAVSRSYGGAITEEEEKTK